MLNNCRIVVLGRGMLGSEVIRECSGRGASVTSFDLPTWDVANPVDRKNAVAEADVLINCAAYTNVDGAESHRDQAFEVNAVAVGELGKLCAGKRIPMLHVSTDFVFDGEKEGFYSEDEPTSPVNVYGESKLAGEQALAATGCNWAIMRVQWSYGANGVNFVTKIQELAKARGELMVVDDQVGAPTSTVDMAGALAEMVEKGATGIYHYAAAGKATRYDVAEMIVRTLGLDCALSRCDSSQFPSPARRPKNSLFDCSKFDHEIGIARQDWKAAIHKFLEGNR